MTIKILIEGAEVELTLTKCKTTQALYKYVHIISLRRYNTFVSSLYTCRATFDLPKVRDSPITILLEVMHKVAPFYIPCEVSLSCGSC